MQACNQDKRLKKCIPIHFYGIKDTTDWVEIKQTAKSY